MELQVGSAVVDMTPRTPCFLAGYAARDHAHEGVHDALSLRALYVRGRSGDALLVSADVLWFCEDAIERMQAVLEKELGLLPLNVLFCGTHTHSAPVVTRQEINTEWRSVLEKQAVTAAAIAKTRLQEVSLKVARGRSEIGMNRRELTPDGRVVLGLHPEGAVDREVIVLGMDGTDGTPVARVCGFACHGTMMSQRNYQLSGDWMGVAAAQIESATGGAFLLMNGGAANVAPRIDRQEAFEPVAELASEFASDFQKVCAGLETLPDDDEVGGAELTVQLPRKLGDVEDGQGKWKQVRLQGLRIGPLRLLGFPGELFSETTMAVKASSPHPLTMVCSYASGRSGGYVPVAEAYETGGYEVRVTPYSETAEAVLRSGLLDLAGALA